jgi:hypothetical protein
MKCDLLNRDKLLDDYINEALSEKDREKFEEHCFNCEICFQEVKLRDKKAGLAKPEWDELYADYLEKRSALEAHNIKKPGSLKSFIAMLSQIYMEIPYRFVYATATAAAILILCFFIYKSTTHDKTIKDERYILAEQDSSQVKPQITEQADSFVIKEPEEHFAIAQKQDEEKEVEDLEEISEENEEIDIEPDYAANFTPYPVYEYVIGEATRSTDYSIQVLSPKIDEDVKDSLLFRWETDYKGPLYLEIFTNRDSLIFSEQPEDNKLVFTKKLKPGLYYWKLLSKDELLYIGKFFVGKGERGE